MYTAYEQVVIGMIIL